MGDYDKLGKNEIPKARITSYTGEDFLISYNEFTGNFILYSIDKNNVLTKIKSNGNPIDYNSFIYSKGKPPKIKDIKEISPYEEILVFSTAEELKKLKINKDATDSYVSINKNNTNKFKNNNLVEKSKSKSQNTSSKNKTKTKNTENRSRLI